MLNQKHIAAFHSATADHWENLEWKSAHDLRKSGLNSDVVERRVAKQLENIVKQGKAIIESVLGLPFENGKWKESFGQMLSGTISGVAVELFAATSGGAWRFRAAFKTADSLQWFEWHAKGSYKTGFDFYLDTGTKETSASTDSVADLGDYFATDSSHYKRQ